MKPAQGDALDKFLASMDDPDSWKSVYDELTGENRVLTKQEMDLLKRIQAHEFPDADFDPYQPTVEWFTVMPRANLYYFNYI